MGFAGVVVLMSKDIGTSIGPILGQLAVVVACMFYAGSSVYARKSTTEASGIIRGAGPLFASTAVMWLAAFTLERPITIPHLPVTWIALLWLGILGRVLFILNYYLIHEIRSDGRWSRSVSVQQHDPRHDVASRATELAIARCSADHRKFGGCKLATKEDTMS